MTNHEMFHLFLMSAGIKGNKVVSARIRCYIEHLGKDAIVVDAVAKGSHTLTVNGIHFCAVVTGIRGVESEIDSVTSRIRIYGY